MTPRKPPTARQRSEVAVLFLSGGRWCFRPRGEDSVRVTSEGRRDRDAAIRDALAAGFGLVMCEGKVVARAKG